MKEKIKKILLVIIVLILFGGGIWWYQYQRYQEKMIKLDACIKSCPESGKGLITRDWPDDKCMESCREKYGITWEEFGRWSNKSYPYSF